MRNRQTDGQTESILILVTFHKKKYSRHSQSAEGKLLSRDSGPGGNHQSNQTFPKGEFHIVPEEIGPQMTGNFLCKLGSCAEVEKQDKSQKIVIQCKDTDEVMIKDDIHGAPETQFGPPPHKRTVGWVG